MDGLSFKLAGNSVRGCRWNGTGGTKSIGERSEPDTPPRPQIAAVLSAHTHLPWHLVAQLYVLCCARCTFPLSSYSSTSCRRWQKFIVCENVLTSLKSSLRRLPSWIYICVSLIVCVWSSYRAWRALCRFVFLFLSPSST